MYIDNIQQLNGARQSLLYTAAVMKHGQRLGSETVYGPHEVAALAGVRPQTVAIWRQRHRGEMPDPDATISGVPLWLEDTIIPWLRETSRLEDE